MTNPSTEVPAEGQAPTAEEPTRITADIREGLHDIRRQLEIFEDEIRDQLILLETPVDELDDEFDIDEENIAEAVADIREELDAIYPEAEVCQNEIHDRLTKIEALLDELDASACKGEDADRIELARPQYDEGGA